MILVIGRLEHCQRNPLDSGSGSALRAKLTDWLPLLSGLDIGWLEQFQMDPVDRGFANAGFDLPELFQLLFHAFCTSCWVPDSLERWSPPRFRRH